MELNGFIGRELHLQFLKEQQLVCLEAVKAASAKGITISTDLNYRAKLWNYGVDREAIMTELTSYGDIISGNEEDAEKHFGIHPEGLDVHKHGHDLKAEAVKPVIIKKNNWYT